MPGLGIPGPRRRGASPGGEQARSGSPRAARSRSPRRASPAAARDPSELLLASKRTVATLRRSPGPAWAGRYTDGSWDGPDLAAYLGLAAPLVEAVVEFPDFFHSAWADGSLVRVRAARGVVAPGVDPWAVAAPMRGDAPEYAPGAVRRGARR